jgi:hypothetical protein
VTAPLAQIAGFSMCTEANILILKASSSILLIIPQESVL